MHKSGNEVKRAPAPLEHLAVGWQIQRLFRPWYTLLAAP